MSDALPLPPRPNLEQYRKLAKELQSACKSNDPAAIRHCAARWGPEAARIAQRWHQLRETRPSTARCTLADAQFFLAREHGFANWPKFAAHVTAQSRADSPVSQYEAAADAIVTGDLPTLQQLLRDDPALVRARSTRDHRSTLLHYVSANGIEDFRQKTPPNIVKIANLLLDAGADVDAESDAYGGGCTPLGLVATSVHPERAGVQLELLRALLARGARMEQPSAAGRSHPIVNACLNNGQPKAAEFLAGLGAPVDLEAAAALGRLHDVESGFAGSTPLQVTAAFFGACWYGHAEIVAFLLEKGTSPALQNAGGQTGLHAAAYGPHVEVIRLLLRHGAPVHAQENTHHATPLDVALWTCDRATAPSTRERCYEAIALLAQAGT